MGGKKSWGRKNSEDQKGRKKSQKSRGRKKSEGRKKMKTRNRVEKNFGIG